LPQCCELTTTLPDGKIIYKNAFSTNFEISKDNVKDIVADGRARWKVENENNKSNCVGHTKLRRYAQADVNVISHGVPFV
jgi:hypothetical protein